MRLYILFIIVFFSINPTFSQNSEWENVGMGFDNCYGLLNYEIERKQRSYDSSIYEARIIFTTGQNDYDFEVTIQGNKEKSKYRIKVPAQGSVIHNLSGDYKASESIDYKSSQFIYVGLDLENLRGKEQYALCGEGVNEVLRRDQAKKKKNKKENSKNKDTALEEELENNNGYTVLNVDDSKFKKEKEAKRLKNNLKSQKDQEKLVKAEKQRKLKAQQLEDAQNFIKNQKKQTLNQEKLAKELTQKFNQISDSWAKENQFQSKMSSLTNIKSVNANSIISEAKSKAQQINKEYSAVKDDALNQSVGATQTLIKSAKTEKQAVVGGLLGTLGTIASQSNLEKSRKDAQAKLEREKKIALEKLSNNIIDKYKPLSEQYLQAAKFAVLESEENYYLSQYEYSKCMTDNAYEIIVNDYACSKPTKTTKPKKRKYYTAKSYFEAYKRKSQNTSQEIKDHSNYFLDLAIDKEPKNPKWLFEKSQLSNIDLVNKLAILKKVRALDKKNKTYKKAYNDAIKEYEVFLQKKEDYTNTLIKNTLINLAYGDYDWKKHENLKIIIVTDYNEKYFINQKGEKILEVSNYDSVSDFFDEFAIISKEGLYGYINKKNEVVIPLKYPSAGVFSKGKATVVDANIGLIGYINKKGETVIPFQFLEATNFSEGLAFVTKLKDGKRRTQNYVPSHHKKSYYIDEKGNEKFSGRFDKGTAFVNGSAIVVKYKTGSFMGGGNSKYRYIDKDGEYLFNKGFDRAEPFNENGYAIVADEKLARGHRYFIIDHKGKKQHKGTFEKKPVFTNGLAILNQGGIFNKKYVIIDETGNIITEQVYESIDNFKEGKALVVDKKGERYYIDTTGKPIKENTEEQENKANSIKTASTPAEVKKAVYDAYDVVIESEGGYWVEKNKLKGYLNSDGEIVIPVENYQLGQFHDGLAFYCPKKEKVSLKYGYINTKGEIIVKPKYQEASNFQEGYAVVGKVSLLGRKVGYINTDGKVAIKLKYYTASPFKDGKATVNDGSYFNPKIFTIDKEGTKIN